tara:strand:- start:3049 stop:3822 length:774 start_codon:yes stop_codon:yes gene_type:complete
MLDSESNLDGRVGAMDYIKNRNFIEILDKRKNLYISVFLLFFIIGFPISEYIIDWLIEAEGFIPENVQIVIIQPLEKILLHINMASQMAFVGIIIFLVFDISARLNFSESRIKKELKSSLTTSSIFFIFLIILILGIFGFLYSHEILVPFLLDYLSQDATDSNLVSTWRLKNWIGFIFGLYLSSIFCFQIPILLVISLKVGLVSRELITENRAIVWFVSLFLGALISPPDPLSLFLVGGPMLVLIEISLIIDRISSK